jgi:SAM-dependent methyltransferase
MEHVESCPICYNKNFEFFLCCTDFTTTRETFNIVKCTGCNFLLTNPRPNSEEIGRYYQSSRYISHTGSKKNLFEKLYHLARVYSLQQKRNLIEEFSKPKSLLDFGCGTGEFIKYFKENGWTTEGVEPSSTARQKSIELSGSIVYSNIQEIKGKKFDVITLWHVLEHVHELNETISTLINLLEKDGKIFIAVPNPESEDANKYKEHWAAYDVPRHLWHFNMGNMKDLLSKHGLKVFDIKPMKLDSFYVSMLSEEYKQSSSKTEQMLKGLFTGVSSNAKARKNNNYSSLIYIAGR